jgi:hypothetical protein
MGTSFRAALSWGIPVTVVDLVPSVPKVFGFFHADGEQLLRSPRATVVIDDDRRYLERTRDTYDVIVVDPPPPVAAAGSSLLYSTEFYRVLARRLSAGGILQQWLPGADFTTGSAFAQALCNSFPYVRTFRSIEGWGFHFLCSFKPLPRRSAAGSLEGSAGMGAAFHRRSPVPRRSRSGITAAATDRQGARRTHPHRRPPGERILPVAARASWRPIPSRQSATMMARSRGRYFRKRTTSSFSSMRTPRD